MNQLTVRSAIAGIALATAAASLASVQSASASDDADPTAKEKEQSAPYDPGVPEGMTAEQLQLNDQMAAAVGEIRAIGDDLYYVSPDPATKVLTVAWKRPVLTKISALDSTTINGFTVDVVPTEFSQDDVLEAGSAVLQLSRAGTIPEVSSITGLTGEPGIQIEVPQAVISKQGRANLEAVYATAANMPVKVVPGEPIVEETRQNDSDPWYGGGMMEAPGFNPPNDLNPYLFCSTGFAVLATGNYGRLLSARHCDDDLANNICNRAWKDGAHDNLTVGDASVDCRVNNDTMLIDPIGGTDGWVHGGPWNATSSHSRYHLKVAGSDRAFQNEWVCESGANSGEHCGLQIEEATLRQWNCGPGQCHGWTADDRNSSTMTSAGGDSGGPVYHPRGDGRVGARGIHYGGTGNPTCSPVRFAVSNCSNKSTFVDIVRILNQWDVDIETTP